MIFDAIFGLDTFPNKVRLTEDEPWLWGYTLTVDEVTKLLSGQTVSYIHNNKEKIAIPDIKYGNRYGKDVLLWKNKF